MSARDKLVGINHSLEVVICQDASDAIAKGYDYNKRRSTPVSIDRVVIVNKGTVAGNATVDLVLKDKDGNEYVTMVTARLLKALPL